MLIHSLIMAIVAGGVAILGGDALLAQQSTLDDHRAAAATAFDRRLDTLNTMRLELSDDWKAYARACRGKVTKGRGLGVVLLQSELAWVVQALQIENETTPPCRMLVTKIQTRSQHVARELEQIDDDARRRGIYPGVMRDLKRRHGLE